MRALRWVPATCLAALAVGVLTYGCSSGSQPPPLGGNDGVGPDASVQPCVNGQTRSCHVNLGNHDGVVTCFNGQQVCNQGVWSACRAPQSASFAVVNRGHGLQTSGGPRAVSALESEHARSITADVQARFLRPAPPRLVAPHGIELPFSDLLRRGATPVLAAANGTRLELGPDGAHALATSPSTHASRPAHVVLPLRAGGELSLADDASAVAIRVRLLGTADVPLETAGGLAVYPSALPGADVIDRPTAAGTEDFVLLHAPPAQNELRYEVDVSKIAGLRLVGGTLEFLDAGGAPRLRAAGARVYDAAGHSRPAGLRVVGCAVDTSPAPPWNRPVVSAGSRSCELRVSWTSDGLSYPLLVDPAWVATGALNVSRYGHVSALLASGRVLVAGGYDTNGSGYVDSAELYDPSTGTWATTGSMGAARFVATASLLGSGQVLVAGGSDNSGPLATAELYDPTAGTFSPTTGPMTSARQYHAATVLGSGQVLLTGGLDGNYDLSSSAEVYLPASGVFSAVGSMTDGRALHAASLLPSGQVLVTGGYEASTWAPGASAELYSPGPGTFAATGSMSTARAGQAQVVLQNGSALVTGGYDATYTPTTSAELFDNGSFTATGTMLNGRAYHTLTLLQSGSVLAAGGFDPTSFASPSSSLYDPVAGTFAALSDMGYGRGWHTANVLPSGKVLVAGGLNDYVGSLYDAELLELVPAGGACGTNADCVSDSCNDGFCCASTCNGTCTACQQGTGACLPVVLQDDFDTCTGANTCNGSAQCVPKTTICTNDPCDPTCVALPPSDAGLGGEAALADSGAWQGVIFGAGGAINPGFTKKGLNDCSQTGTPCSQYQYGEWNACQFDTYCVPGSCKSGSNSGSCVQYGAGQTATSQVSGATCNGVDLTLGVACTDSTGNYEIPICNRGTTSIAAGTTITLAFFGGNSSHFPGSPQCTSLQTSPTCAVAAPWTLAPGDCFDLTTSSAGAGGYSSCAANLKSGNQTVMVNPDLSLAECMLGPEPGTGFTQSPGGCDDNWTDLHSAGGSCSGVGVSYSQVVYTQQYVATCPSGTEVVWGSLIYSGSTPSDSSGSSSIQLTAQTAPLLVDGGVGTFGATHTLVSAPPDPSTCLLPGCYVDTYTKLGGTPDANDPVLDLTITLNPSPDKQVMSTLASWQLTYSCAPSE